MLYTHVPEKSKLIWMQIDRGVKIQKLVGTIGDQCLHRFFLDSVYYWQFHNDWYYLSWKKWGREAHWEGEKRQPSAFLAVSLREYYFSNGFLPAHYIQVLRDSKSKMGWTTDIQLCPLSALNGTGIEGLSQLLSQSLLIGDYRKVSSLFYKPSVHVSSISQWWKEVETND